MKITTVTKSAQKFWIVEGQTYYGWRVGWQPVREVEISKKRAFDLASKMDRDNARTLAELAEQRELRLRGVREYLAERAKRCAAQPEQMDLFL